MADPLRFVGGFAQNLRRRLSDDESKGLAGASRPSSDIRGPSYVAAEQSFGIALRMTRAGRCRPALLRAALESLCVRSFDRRAHLAHPCGDRRRRQVAASHHHRARRRLRYSCSPPLRSSANSARRPTAPSCERAEGTAAGGTATPCPEPRYGNHAAHAGPFADCRRRTIACRSAGA